MLILAMLALGPAGPLALPVLAQSAGTVDPVGALVQYGALGILVVILLGVVRVLYLDKAKQHEQERARADRLESLVLAQSQAMVDKIIPVLTAATQTMTDLLERLERDGRPRP